jgi:hypothetical protein
VSGDDDCCAWSPSGTGSQIYYHHDPAEFAPSIGMLGVEHRLDELSPMRAILHRMKSYQDGIARFYGIATHAHRDQLCWRAQLKRHSTGLPDFSSLTMTRSRACGFFHSNSFTVPLKVTLHSASNMSKEWCANAGAMSAATAMAVRLTTSPRMI